MSLYFIGTGMYEFEDISVKGFHYLKQCDVIYFETYTCILKETVEELEEKLGKKVIPANRELVEQQAETTILKDAKNKHVAFLVIGDSLSATTHTDLFLRAKELEIKTYVIPGSSIFTGIGITGLQVYKFGKTTSIPMPHKSFKPKTHYQVLKENKKMGLHTLALLDLRPEENKFMTVNEAIQSFLDIEKEEEENIFTENTYCVGCARLGSMNPTIIAGKAKDLLKKDFGKEVHCLIIPGKMHFKEEEFLKIYE